MGVLAFALVISYCRYCISSPPLVYCCFKTQTSLLAGFYRIRPPELFFQVPDWLTQIKRVFLSQEVSTFLMPALYWWLPGNVPPNSF
jgi:hypothetical protein